jgi:predicted aldo/keto reductase-like oxidoreductase
MNRRDFIRTSAMVVLGTQVPFRRLHAQEKVKKPKLKRTKRGNMYYRRLGRTDLMVSEISLGGSPVPSEPVFKKAIEMGVNYVDTSQSYMRGNSERQIGKLIKDRRDKFFVSTKFHAGRRKKTKEQIIKEAEESLARLDSDYVDCYLLHGASSSEILLDEEVLSAFDQLKKDGKIRFTGTSCHRDPAGALIPAIKSGKYDMVTVAYNAYSGDQEEKDKVYDDYLATSGIGRVLAAAKEKDVGVVAMKSMAGGDRQNLAAFKAEGVTLPQSKLKWVLKNDAVGAIITEMMTFEMLEENIGASGAKAGKEEEEALKKYVKATSRETCRMCGTCYKQCPSRVAIPDILRYASYYHGYGKPMQARAAYRSLPDPATYRACDGCGKCEAACPFSLPILRKLHHAHRLLA